MSYYFTLAFKYIKFNKARTMYSVLGIMLSFVLCFGMMTLGYSAWDYNFLSDYKANPYELYYIDLDEEHNMIPYTPQMLAQLNRLIADADVAEIIIYEYDPDTNRGNNRVLPGQLTVGRFYNLWIRLKDTSDLQKSAQQLSAKYGFKFEVISAAAVYYGQGEKTNDAMVSFFITLAATLFGGYSVVLLRNTMMIAVAERGKDFGLLRCVGMSDHQHRMMLFAEGFIMSLLASLIGTGFGFWLLKLMEPWFIKTLGLASFFTINFYPKAAVYTTVLCVVVTLFSLFEPARLCAQVSPLEALHGVMAKELTVGRAIMLLAGKIRGGRKKKRKQRIPLIEKIFGAPGFYAHRNLMRGKGKGVGVFVAMMFSMFFLLTLPSFVDSYKAVLEEQIQDMHTDYTEYLYILRNNERELLYDEERHEKLREVLMKMDNVKDCFWLSYNATLISDFSGYSYDKTLKELNDANIVDMVYEMGCTRQDMEKERPYLIEGEIDYERMIKENGVLICDVSTLDETKQRKTGYKAGDMIEVLSTEGAIKAKELYCEALAVVSERYGIYAWQDAQGKLISFENGEKKESKRGQDDTVMSTLIKQGVEDEQFVIMENEMLDELKKAGYDCREYMRENSVRMPDVLKALRECIFESGEKQQLKVFGILSDEICTGIKVDLLKTSGKESGKYIRIIMPMESMSGRLKTVYDRDGDINSADDIDYLGYISYDIPDGLEILVYRDMEILDEELRGFADNNGLWYYSLYLESGVDYFEVVNMLNFYRVLSTIVGGFILIICMTQLLNTLQADMRIHRHEIWLYDVVGMDPSQKIKMMLLEHGFGAAAACVIGALASFIFCYLLIEKTMNVNGEFIFRWPVIPAVLIVAGVLGLILTVNIYEWKKQMRMIK